MPFHIIKFYWITMVLVLCGQAASPQQPVDKQKDILDVLFAKKKAEKPPVSDSLLSNKLYLSPLPIVGYSPSLGAVVGGGLSASLRTGSAATTSISSGLANVTFTSKKQINISVRTNIYAPNNKWIFQGDWRLLFFSQPTYGLGINFTDREPFNWNGLSIKRAPNEQPQRFNYVRIYENVYRRLIGNLYAGAGINLDLHFNIKDQLLDTTLPGITLTSHYLYSKKQGFSLKRYASSGLSFSVLFDSRDNAVNAAKGQFAQLSYRINPEFLGSSKANTIFQYDYRAFIKLWQQKPLKHILALWTWGQFLTGGQQPYLGLPAIGWDMYNRSGRGYIQGRIRGENFWYSEAEYRFGITKNGLLGGVAFVNSTSASNYAAKQYLAQKFAWGYGVGLRVKMSRQSNTNITIDYGRGQNGSGGIYFNLQETF